MSTVLSIEGKKATDLEVLSEAAADNLVLIHDGSGLKTIAVSDVFFLYHGSGAQQHNGIFRGKDLTDVYTIDELSEKVLSGDFSDLYIGDYITVSITTSYGGTEEVDLVIAAFDYFLGSGSPETEDHNIAFVVRDCFATTAAMNSSSSTSGGYAGSDMCSTVLPVYATALNSALDDHILNHYRYLTTTVSTSADSAAGAGLTGSSAACTWTAVDLCLMSEAMVFGGSAFSSSGRDISDACIQLPLFALAPNYRIAGQGKGGDRCAWWLCGVASSTSFCFCGNNGDANCASASGTTGVRPYFLFA